MPATRARPAMTRNAIRFEENALRVEEDAPSFESTFQGIRKSMGRSRHSQDFRSTGAFSAAVGRISDASSWNSRAISESDGRVAWGVMINVGLHSAYTPRLGWEAFKNFLCGRFDRSAVAEIRPLGRDDHGGAARSRADRDGVPVVGLQDSEGGLRNAQ